MTTFSKDLSNEPKPATTNKWYYGGLGLTVVLLSTGLYYAYQHYQQTSPEGNLEGMQNKGSLGMKDEVVGTGKQATPGATITVHYDGHLGNGVVFDSSRARGAPFVFQLGAGQVIKGWDQGIQGMKEGGKRKLIIPPHLAYGPNAVGSIPPNSTLEFVVELLKVE